MSKHLLDKWLSVFITETCTQNGHPKTIYSLITGIVRHMRAENPEYPPNVIDKTDPAFTSFRTTTDKIFKRLRGSGVDKNSKHTEGISNDEEKLLRDTGVLNSDTPKGLL